MFMAFPVEDITYYPKHFQGENWAKEKVDSSDSRNLNNLPSQMTVDYLISTFNSLNSDSPSNLYKNAVKYLDDYKKVSIENRKLKEEVARLSAELEGFRVVDVVSEINEADVGE